MAANFPISHYFGESLNIPYLPKKTVVNIGGWKIQLTIRSLYAPKGSIVFQGDTTGVQVSGGSSGTGPVVFITDAVNSIFNVQLTTAQTQVLTLIGDPTKPSSLGNYVYDIWRTDSGNEFLMAFGTWSVLPQARLAD